MDKASRILVPPGKTPAEANEAAVVMYRALTGKEPSKEEMEELESEAAKDFGVEC